MPTARHGHKLVLFNGEIWAIGGHDSSGTKNNGSLMEPEPMQLYSPMPLIHFKPAAHAKKKSTEGYYQCPLYYYPHRTGSRERPSFMIWVDLKSGPNDANFWIIRGMAWCAIQRPQGTAHKSGNPQLLWF